MSQPSEHPIVFFDGVCNLCNGAVQFIIRHDKQKRFLFAPLQSEAGKRAVAALQGTAPDSIILFYEGRYYIKSAAVLRIARLLGGVWALGYAAIIIPRFLLDPLYGFIARNRYRWFGRHDECMIPTPELRERFLS